MDNVSEIPEYLYDVAVIGAGPAGAEASLAAAAAGASTVCLTINLDNVGFHPANPILVDSMDDRRHILLEEITTLGVRLTALLEQEGIAQEDDRGRLLLDRRNTSLAYKEALEYADGLDLRQALATTIQPTAGGWAIETSLDERFRAGALVVASGTFLDGEVTAAGRTVPGGRQGEIPANSLSLSLMDLGLSLERVTAHADARISRSGLTPGCPEPRASLPADGSQLGEYYAYGLDLGGDTGVQLAARRESAADPGAWLTRPSYRVTHLVLSPGQLDRGLGSKAHPGLFLAGRVAGSCNFLEAATLGFIAGRSAAAYLQGTPDVRLIVYPKYVTELSRLAESGRRLFTIRDTSPGTC